MVSAPPCLGSLSSLSLECEPHDCLPRVEIIACSRCSINVDEMNKTGAENHSYLGKTLLASNIARKMPFETDFCSGEKFAIRSSSDNQTKGVAGDLGLYQIFPGTRGNRGLVGCRCSWGEWRGFPL